MKILKNFKWICLCIALLSFAAAIIIYPERYINCCFQGFAMWAECVLPSLFPFMVITLLFIKTGLAEKAALPLKKVTGILGLPPAAAVCFVMSVCSGYPAGSKAVAEFYADGCVDADGARKLAYLCSTSGPLFIIGSVGYKMFGDKTAGLKILVAHVVSVLAVALIISLSKKETKTEYRRAVPDGNLLYNTFYGAVISVAVAGGFIAFFYVAGQFIEDFNILYPLEKLFGLFCEPETASAACRGIIEATAGCRALAEANGTLALPLAGFTITFGGASILLQQLGYLTKAGIKPLKFIAVKFVQGVLCFFILLAAV